MHFDSIIEVWIPALRAFLHRLPGCQDTEVTVIPLYSLVLPFLDPLESLVKRLCLFDPGLPLQPVVGAPCLGGKSCLPTEDVERFTQVSAAQLRYAVLVELVVMDERRESGSPRSGLLEMCQMMGRCL